MDTLQVFDVFNHRAMYLYILIPFVVAGSLSHDIITC